MQHLPLRDVSTYDLRRESPLSVAVRYPSAAGVRSSCMWSKTMARPRHEVANVARFKWGLTARGGR